MSKNTAVHAPTVWGSEAMQNRISARYRKERRFRLLGLFAILLALSFLAILLFTLGAKSIGGFFQTKIELTIHFDRSLFPDLDGLNSDEASLALTRVDYAALIRQSLMDRFPDVRQRRDVRSLASLVSAGARQTLAGTVRQDPAVIGATQDIWFLASGDIDSFVKGKISRDVPESDRRVKDREVIWIDALDAAGKVKVGFNWGFFSSGDSREAELAGIWGAIVGSFLTLVVTLLFSFPIGLAAAVYLEEFAPQNKFTDLIEININNLAAVPSIVFGLLGLAVLLGFFNMPRSSPFVGGLTLGLMTLPTLIIAGRAAIKAVQPSIRDAAIGLGASPMQTVFHHVIPLAMPGILTGTIIGMARALGETAPLLMIGMVAFIVDVPESFSEAATVLPVQIFLWANSPERAFVDKTSAAIIVLLLFLILMNGLAVWLRNRFERQW